MVQPPGVDGTYHGGDGPVVFQGDGVTQILVVGEGVAVGIYFVLTIIKLLRTKKILSIAFVEQSLLLVNILLENYLK